MTMMMATITPIASSRRRGYSSDRLLERDGELAVLGQCLHDTGAGGVVFVEAPAGGGKSRVLGAARELARESQTRILTAAGAELEREFPFALAMQLFEPLSVGADEGNELLRRPLALAATLLDDAHRGGSKEPDGRQYSVIHGLFQATRKLVGPRSEDEQAMGLAILIDDLHWADRPSLRFLAYLAQRAAELPIAIVLSATPGEPSADPQALATLRRAAAAGRLLPLAPLGADGVARVVRRLLPQADAEFCASCARVSGGNPFLLTELLAAISEDQRAPAAACAPGIGEIVPDAVRDSVAARLESMPPATRAVAKAVAVLGEGASVRRIARLAELDSEIVLIAADQLAAMQLLAPGISLSFAQPMLGTAIRASLAPFERAQAHLRAGRILTEQHAGAELIAGHLLEAPADDDPAAVAVLRDAAEAALQRAEPERAIRLLARALAEHPAQALRVELLTALAAAEAEAGRPDATERLSEAWRISEHPERRAELALAHGQALYAQGEFRAAADALHAGLAELDGEGELAGELSAAYIAAAALVGELSTEALAARDRLIADQAEGLRPSARAAIAHTLVLDGLQGAPRSRIGELAQLAWGDGALLESRDSAPFSVPLLATGLVIADDLELALEICDAALQSGGDQDLPAAHGFITYARAWALYEQGRLTEAQAVANTALAGVAGGGHG
jgi:tetratricopeptide (TPR) repeat protein